MILHKVLRRGYDHHDFCQDFLSIRETPNYLYMAVFDGCSGGVDSQFASILFSKSFNYIIDKNVSFFDDITKYDAQTEETTLERLMNELIYTLSIRIKKVRETMSLSVEELLSTVVFCAIDKKTRQCIIYAFGDGYFRVDETEVHIKNTRYLEMKNGENMPDYIAYDLDVIENYEGCCKWIGSKSDIYKFENVSDVTISSDGIQTFRQFKQAESIDPISYLVRDEFLMDGQNMLEKKCNILKTRYGLMNTDDISIIRVRF